MELAVWKVGKPLPSKFDDGFMTITIQMKSLKASDKKSYKLNLTTRHKDAMHKWLPHMIEGTVLKVQMQPNGINVNPFTDYTVIKAVNKKAEK